MRYLTGLLGSAALCVAMSGCAAITDLATNVGQTSAQLNGHGHTDATPAHYFFQYATNQSDLGTSAAQRTPTRGPIPAHYPSGGGDVAFNDTVAGLAPGRTYLFEVCGGDGQIRPDACGGIKHFFTTPSPAQDSVSGAWVILPPEGPGGSVQAAVTTTGQNADGELIYYPQQNGNGPAFVGRVSCLVVHGNRAAVGAVGQLQSSSGSQPQTFLLTVIDDGPISSPAGSFRKDSIASIEQAGSTAPDCAHASFVNTTPIQYGDITVADGTG